MSWSVGGSGPIEAVGPQVKADFAKVNSDSNLVHHEEHLKDKAAGIVAEVLSLQPAGSMVTVDCAGTVSDEAGSNLQHSLKIIVTGTGPATPASRASAQTGKVAPLPRAVPK